MNNFIQEILRLIDSHFASYILIAISIAVLNTYVLKNVKNKKNKYSFSLILLINLILMVAMACNFTVFVLCLDALSYTSEKVKILDNIYSIVAVVTLIYWLFVTTICILREIRLKK